MTEIWKTIPNFSNYEVSSLGNIRNKKTLKELAKNSLRGGYIRVGITNDDNERKQVTIHRVVAITFIPNPENKYTVNHIDHDKLNNSVKNLEWASTTEQNRHKRKVPKEKQRLMSSRKVWKINQDTDEKIELYETIRDAAKWVFDNNLTSITDFNNGNNIKTQICAVCRENRNSAYGFKWEYDNSEVSKYENEIWKPISKKLITEGHNKPNDYKWVSVYPKQYLLHILVAKTFLPNFYGKKIVNHKDGNKTNCKLYNLEWCTPSENSQHAHNTLLNPSGKKINVTDTKTNKVTTYKNLVDFSVKNNITLGKCRYAINNNRLLNNLYKLQKN